MTAVAEETRQARDLIQRVETLEGVANSLPEQDERRDTLLHVVEQDLAQARALRPRIAAELLGLSERTVRAWVKEGVLTQADASSRRLLLDVRRVHEVLHVVTALRTAGRTTGLLDEVHRRLVDETWLDRHDLAESLEQMQRGEGTIRVPGPSA
jgi:DNA-binding transcriptional MerR regulator